MIVQDIYIDDYSWRARIFYAVTRYDVDRIMESLHGIGCRARYAAAAYRSLIRNELNSGFTFSNFNRRCSVVVVALASSSKQFHRCLVHELRHLQSHIASTDNIDEKSEQVCYLLDDLIGLTHDTCSHLLCGCCRKNAIERYGKTEERTQRRTETRMPVQARQHVLPKLRKAGLRAS